MQDSLKQSRHLIEINLPQKIYYENYENLKSKYKLLLSYICVNYNRYWVNIWEEKTDPAKFVFEDIVGKPGRTTKDCDTK